MSILPRIVTFGASSGLAWSLAPGVFGGMFDDGTWFPTLVVSIITGILVSLALAIPLLKSKHWTSSFLGVPAMPAAAFCFGFMMSFSGRILGSPFENGFMYAFWSMVSIYGFVFFPSAIFTTFLFRRWLLIAK